MIFVVLVLAVLICFGFVVLFGAPYVPTLKNELEGAFDDLYKLKKSDVVVDLGSGDGRVLLAAIRRGSRAYGYELNPLLVLVARLRLAGRATVLLRDMWSTNLPEGTTLVYVFTVSRDVNRLSRYLQAQSDRCGRPLAVMTFGPAFKDREPVKSHRGHMLYEIRPMQRRSA